MACGDVPICALSTGTNNVFPEMREATVAGIATGFVATGRARRARAGAARRRSSSSAPGRRPDLALVDVAVSRERFVGARALWRHEALRELFVAFADPGAVGLSSVAGQLAPMARGGGPRAARAPRAAIRRRPRSPSGRARARARQAGRDRELRAARAGRRVTLAPGAGTLALDGEREIERSGDDGATVRLAAGPLRIDVDAVMRAAADANAT